MAKKKMQTVQTPTIDKLLAEHEESEKADKVPVQPKPNYVIFQHPIFPIWRTLGQLLVLCPFLLILLVAPLDFTSGAEMLLLQVSFGLVSLSIMISNYIYWRLNVVLIFPDTLQLFYFKNILRQRHESFELDRLNTFDLSRRGFLSYFFNYANLDLSTIVKEVESTDKLSIKRIRRPDEALKIIKFYAHK